MFLIGIYGVQAFAQYYLQDVLRVPDPPKQTGDLMAVLTITLVIMTLAFPLAVGGVAPDLLHGRRHGDAHLVGVLAGFLRVGVHGAEQRRVVAA